MADAGEDMRAPFKARPLTEVVDSFLLTKRVSNCTPATLKVYQWWLVKLARDVPDTASLDSLAVTTFLSRLRERGLGPSSIHQAWRTLRTFTRWMLAMGLLRQNPLASLTLRTPKTLPSVPSEADVQALLRACPPNSFNGRRAPAIVLVFADTGIRQSELRHLLIEHVDLNARTIVIRAGKGQRDRVVPFSPTTARALRLWLMLHPMAYPESPMFAAKTGNPLQARNAVHLLHRLSVAAKLRRKVGPHSLRHFCATQWIRAGMGLDEVRRLLGHASLTTTLRYSSLVSADLQAAHKKASVMERLQLG